MKLTFALATACALLSAPAFAQSQTPPQPETLSQTSGFAPAVASISTPEFFNRAIMSDIFYTKAAKMTEQKGHYSSPCIGCNLMTLPFLVVEGPSIQAM
jgi:hypothetical protein